MADKTAIEWTDSTWSPIRVRVRADAAAIAHEKRYTSLIPIAERMAGRVGPHCEHVSPGCGNCYAETNNRRCLPGNGTGLPYDRRSRDLIEPFIDEKILRQPIGWKAPRKIFVENQSDLFGEWVPDELIDRVFAVMALCPQHTFQVLTKRPERMRKYLASAPWGQIEERAKDIAVTFYRSPCADLRVEELLSPERLPLANMQFGVSCEDQATADERIPLLLQTPAAVRFISAEPLLAPIDIASIRRPDEFHRSPYGWHHWWPKKLHWVIVGGESGPGARPCDVEWIRSIVQQCKDAQVPCFVKQLGAKPYMSREADGVFVPNYEFFFRDRKGGDWSEWPEDLRVREFPEAAQ